MSPFQLLSFRSAADEECQGRTGREGAASTVRRVGLWRRLVVVGHCACGEPPPDPFADPDLSVPYFLPPSAAHHSPLAQCLTPERGGHHGV